MKKHLSRLLYCLSALVTFSILLAIAFVVIAESTEANRYILNKVSEQVPSIQFDHVSGSIAHDLYMDLTYQTETLSVQVQSLRINLNVSCIWRLAFCIETIEAQSLVIQSQSTETPAEDIALPTIRLPFLIKLQSLFINQFQFIQDNNTLYTAEDIHTRAHWLGTKVALNQFTMTDPYCQWQLSGTLSLHHSYPLLANITCDTVLETIQQDIQYITIQASGDLEQLALTTLTKGRLNANIKTGLNVLNAELPLSIDAALNSPYTLNHSDTASSRIQQLQLHANGNRHALQLKANSQILSSVYSGAIRPQLKATLTPENILVHSLQLQLPKGDIQTTGTLLFGPDFHWQGHSTLNQVNIVDFYPEGSSLLTGALSHDVTLQEKNLLAAVAIDSLNGDLMNKPFHASGKLILENDLLTLHRVALAQADNQLQINGAISNQEADNLTIQLDLPHIQDLYKPASGSLNGQLTLNDSLNAPSLSGKLTGKNLAYNTVQIGQLTLSSQLALNPNSPRPQSLSTNTAKHNHIDLQLDQFSINQQPPSQIQMGIKGNLKTHTLSAQWKDSAHQDTTNPSQINLNCRGHFPNSELDQLMNHWALTCRDTVIRINWDKLQMQWHQEAPLTANIRQNGQEITVSPFCLVQNKSKFCLESPLKWKGGNLSSTNTTAKQLELSWLQPWLPETTLLSGTVNGKLSATFENNRFQSRAHIESTDTRFTVNRPEKSAFELPFTSLALDARIDSENQQILWQTQSPIAGETRGNIQTRHKNLKADIAIKKVNIGAFSEFLSSEDDERIAGMIDGRISADGTFSKPNISGDLEIKQGELQLDVLPLPIKDIFIQLRGQQNRIVMKGEFMASDKKGQLVGRFQTQEESWNAKLKLKTDTLQLSPNEFTQLSVSPDIRFELSPQSLALRGNIHIPKARVRLKSLPEQAISISPDARMVGDDPAHNSLKIFSDLQVSLGDDVKFTGFGLETNLTGKLNLQQSGSDMLRAHGNVRLVDGTYQAYGQNLVINEGDLIFIDDIENPQLRLSATRAKIKDNVIVGILVTGRAQAPNIRIFSTPEMNQQEKLHYLITGRAPNTEGSDSQSVAAETALAMALSKNNKLGKRAGDALGIEDFSISAGSTDDVSEVELSGYITPDLMIRYGVGMFEAVNSLTLSYRIKENLFLEVLSGKNSALDLLWSFDLD